MRTIKELLELALENKQFFEAGMCYWFKSLYYNMKISYHEYKKNDSIHRGTES